MKKESLIWCLITFLIGGFIYVFFRTDKLLMFKWFNVLKLSNWIKYLRETTIPYKSRLPDWLLYSLPDGLWVFSYVSLLLYFWKGEIKSQNFIWFFFIPIFAVLSEFMQLLDVVSGTFDYVDLLFYFLGLIIPFVVFSNSLIKIKNR